MGQLMTWNLHCVQKKGTSQNDRNVEKHFEILISKTEYCKIRRLQLVTLKLQIARYGYWSFPRLWNENTVGDASKFITVVDSGECEVCARPICLFRHGPSSPFPNSSRRLKTRQWRILQGEASCRQEPTSRSASTSQLDVDRVLTR